MFMLNFPIAKKSGARFEVCVCVCVCVCGGGGGCTPLFGLYSSGGAEYKVLRIKQGVVFYF